MNALAEDQLLRLCGLLAGTGIPFGVYVGKTPEHETDVAGAASGAGGVVARRLPGLAGAGAARGSRQPDYRPLVLAADDEDALAVVAELIEVIGTTAPD